MNDSTMQYCTSNSVMRSITDYISVNQTQSWVSFMIKLLAIDSCSMIIFHKHYVPQYGTNSIELHRSRVCSNDINAIHSNSVSLHVDIVASLSYSLPCRWGHWIKSHSQGLRCLRHLVTKVNSCSRCTGIPGCRSIQGKRIPAMYIYFIAAWLTPMKLFVFFFFFFF